MKKLFLGMALATTAIYGTYKVTRSDAPAKAGMSLAQDRIWIDHIPRDDRDTMQIFVALSSDPIGIFQSASQWAGKHELFHYEMMGDQLRVVFPQNGDKEKVTAKATECAVGEFDYCLELAGSSRGTKKYFSMEGWEVSHLAPDAARAKIDAITRKLETKR